MSRRNPPRRYRPAFEPSAEFLAQTAAPLIPTDDDVPASHTEREIVGLLAQHVDLTEGGPDGERVFLLTVGEQITVSLTFGELHAVQQLTADVIREG